MLAVLSWILYGTFVMCATFMPDTIGLVRFKDREVRNPLIRFVIAALFFPFIGAIIWIFGIGFVYIGTFLTLPMRSLLG